MTTPVLQRGKLRLRSQKAGQRHPLGEQRHWGRGPAPSPTNKGPDLKGPSLWTSAYTTCERSLHAGRLYLPLPTRVSANQRFPGRGPGEGSQAGEGQSDDAGPQFPLCTAPTQHPADRAVTPAPDRASLDGPRISGSASPRNQSAKPPTHLSGC